MLTVQTDAKWANRVLNDPEVRPFVADEVGEIDASRWISTPSGLVLGGEFGVFVLFKYFDGCWEVHSAVLREGRGQWAVGAAWTVLHHMFTKTDAAEIITRVPQGHIAAKALSEHVGFRHDFTTPAECVFRGRKVPCHIYSNTIQEWAQKAPGLEQKGRDFHEWLNRQVTEGTPHDDDPAHNRVVGSAVDMAFSGHIRKAFVWYNRWALAARHPLITLVSVEPPQIKFDAGVVTFAPDGVRFDRAH